MYDKGRKKKKRESQDALLLLVAQRTRYNACSIFTARKGHPIKKRKNERERKRKKEKKRSMLVQYRKQKQDCDEINNWRNIYIFSFTV